MAFASLYCCLLVAAYGLGSMPLPLGHWAVLPLIVLLYGLHWRWQGVAYRIDDGRSDRFVSMVKFRRARTDPDW